MSIRITLGGYSALDPVEESRNLADLGKPVPGDFQKANSILNVRGRDPARGWFLMRREDIVANVNNYLSLLLEDGTNSVYIPDLVVSKEPLCLTPSIYADDPDACYLVEVADKRWLACNPYFQVAVNKQYNVRAPAYGGAGSGATLYYVDTLNTGSIWTWTTMVQDLWGLLPMLGAAPALPSSPNGVPEGWVFAGTSAWDALCDVLDRLSMEVVWDWRNGTYSIVATGAADVASDAILTVAEGRKIHDAGYITIVLGREPAYVRVFFHRREQYAGTEETNTRATGATWQTLTPYKVDVAGNNGAAAGTYHVLWDDLPAIYDATGTLTNSAALATRAAERAANYYQSLRTIGGSRLHKTYSGLVLLAPGSTIKGVSWRQRQANPDGEGDLVTEVVRHPFATVRISDQGQWEACDCPNNPNQTPNFGPQWPVYPITDQILEIATGTPSSGLYDGLLEKPSGTTTFADKDAIWGLDLAGSNKLTVGARYLCRLAYYSTDGGGRPVYAFNSIAGLVPSNITFTGDVLFEDGHVEFGKAGHPEEVIFTSGTATFPSTTDATVKPLFQLFIPRLTVAGPPTWSGAEGELICGIDGLYQYSNGTWQTYTSSGGASPVGGLNAIQVDNGSGGFDGDNTVGTFNPATGLMEITNGTETAIICDTDYAFYASVGKIFVVGNAVSNTYEWSVASTAPDTNVGVAIVNYYGANATNFLGDPAVWVLVVVNGNEYRIPCYLPPA